MTNTKDATTRTLSDTAPSNAEDVEIEFLQHLARTIARAEKLNNDVEELWRKTSPEFNEFKATLLEIHEKTSRLALLAKPSEFGK